MRFQLDIPEQKISDIERLMAQTGVETRKDLFNVAMTLLDWVVKECATGRSIVSVNDETDDQYRELVMPQLEHARRLRKARK